MRKLDLAGLRARYSPGYEPRCAGCGQQLACVVYGFFRCPGRVKVKGRWEKCPAPSFWVRPSAEAQDDVLALVAALEEKG